jgi:hypothetical protein
MLRQGGFEEGALDGGGGPEARQLPPHQRPVLLARRAQACRCVTHTHDPSLHRVWPSLRVHARQDAMESWTHSCLCSLNRIAALREELPAAVDQLPAAGPEARAAVGGGGENGDRPALGAGQPVVQDRVAPAGKDGQRDQEPLEHPHQEEAQEDGHRPRHPQAPPARSGQPHQRLAGGGEGHRGSHAARFWPRGVLRRRGVHGAPPGRHRHSRRRPRRAARGRRRRRQHGLLAWIFLLLLLLVLHRRRLGASIERWQQHRRRRVAGVAADGGVARVHVA